MPFTDAPYGRYDSIDVHQVWHKPVDMTSEGVEISRTVVLLFVLLQLLGQNRCGVVCSTESGFRVFAGQDERSLEGLSPQERLEVAAKTGEMITVRMNETSQTGITQEGVYLAIDCSPWLSQFPGGSVQWSFIQLDEFGNPVGTFYKWLLILTPCCTCFESVFHPVVEFVHMLMHACLKSHYKDKLGLVL